MMWKINYPIVNCLLIVPPRLEFCAEIPEKLSVSVEIKSIQLVVG